MKLKDVTLGKYIGEIGGSEPVVMINGYIFTSDMLRSVEISSFGWIPTCSLILSLKTDNEFIVKKFPKDGDLVNIYFRSFTDVLKPIRNDYLITRITTTFSKDKSANYITLFIQGILHIPYLFAERCESYKDKTSYETLLELSGKLKLGFVSNDVNTEDRMTWINAWTTNESFIKHLTLHSYKNDDSFFDSWIDFYYNLNFLNLNKVLAVSDDEEVKEGIYKMVSETDYTKQDHIEHFKSKNILTNAEPAKFGNFYFNKIAILNRSAEISNLNGYSRNIYFYDKVLDKLINFKVDTLITENAIRNKSLLKGRVDEDYYKTTIKSKWLGWQYSLPDYNVHNYYKMAAVHNYQNLIELKKINLILSLPAINFNLYKGQRVFVVFVSSLDAQEAKPNFFIEKSLSYSYLLYGIKIGFEMNRGYFQELLLTRREWPTPSQTWENVKI